MGGRQGEASGMVFCKLTEVNPSRAGAKNTTPFAGGAFGFSFQKEQPHNAPLTLDPDLVGEEFDLTLLADGTDAESSDSGNRYLSSLLYGRKKMWLLHHALRYVFFTNMTGTVVSYTSAATAAFSEHRLLVEAPIWEELNAAFGTGKVGQVLLRVD